MPKVHLQLHHLLLPAYTLHCIVLVSIDIGILHLLLPAYLLHCIVLVSIDIGTYCNS